MKPGQESEVIAESNKDEAQPKPQQRQRAEWTPPQDAQDAVAVIQRYAAAGDKKTCAYFVTAAIDGRTEAKRVRESLGAEAPARPLPEA
jgi:hypothetical protein